MEHVYRYTNVYIYANDVGNTNDNTNNHISNNNTNTNVAVLKNTTNNDNNHSDTNSSGDRNNICWRLLVVVIISCYCRLVRWGTVVKILWWH